MERPVWQGKVEDRPARREAVIKNEDLFYTCLFLNNTLQYDAMHKFQGQYCDASIIKDDNFRT